MCLSKFRSNKNVERNNVSFNGSFCCHVDDRMKKLLPLSHLCFVPWTCFGEILWLDQKSIRMKIPKCKCIETIYYHHIEKSFPITGIAASLIMQLQCIAMTVSIPWKIIFNST